MIFIRRHMEDLWFGWSNCSMKGNRLDLITLQERLKEKDVPGRGLPVRNLSETWWQQCCDFCECEILCTDRGRHLWCVRWSNWMKRLKICAMPEKNLYLSWSRPRNPCSVHERRTTGEYVPIKQVVLNALDKIEKASKSKGTVTGILTGFIDLIINRPASSRQILSWSRRVRPWVRRHLSWTSHSIWRSRRMLVATFSLEMSKNNWWTDCSHWNHR